MAILNPYNYSKPATHVRLKNDQKGLATKNQNTAQQDAYLEQRVLSAKPEELTLMLYDGMVKFIKMARLYNEQGNIEKTGNSLMRAQAIVLELQSTLDMEYEISDQLDSLYDFVYDKLLEGNLSKEDTHMKEALDISIELRDTWKEAMTLL